MVGTINPAQSAELMLRHRVGYASDLLVRRTVDVGGGLLAQLDTKETQETSVELRKLSQACAGYSESKTANSVGAFASGAGWGVLIGAFAGPIGGGIAFWLATGITGTMGEGRQKEDNRIACQKILRSVVEIGLERVKRLVEKMELIGAEAKRLEDQNAALHAFVDPQQFRLWNPSTWGGNNADTSTVPSAITRETAIAKIAENVILVRDLRAAHEAFRHTHLGYVQKFSDSALNGRSCLVGPWSFQMSITSDEKLRLTEGKWA